MAVKRPFARVVILKEEAILAQVFVLLVFSLGMLLSLTRSERIDKDGTKLEDIAGTGEGDSPGG